MRKSKRFIQIISLLVVCMTLLSGCGNGNGKTKSSSYELNDGSAGEYAITKEPVELEIFMVRSGDKVAEDLLVWQEIAKVTNVSLKTVNSTSITDPNQAITTMLASGDLPDVVLNSNIKAYADKYGMEGAFVPLDELVNKKDTPNLFKQMERPEVKNVVKAVDGHYYCIPKLVDGSLPAQGWLIRQDWLDKLNLKAPTTIDEFYTVLKAFRDKDPNGNGLKDEVPYFSRFGTPSALLEMQNIPTIWGVKDGKVFYSPTTDDYKKGISLISKWYAENLIDKEIYTRGAKSRDKLFGDNVGGSTHDWFGSGLQYNDIVKDSVPGFKLVSIAPPGGVELSTRGWVSNAGGAICADSDKIEVAIRFMDFLFSDIGSRFQSFGVEGVHYDMKDGKPYFRDFVLNGTGTAIDVLNKDGALDLFPFIEDFWYEEQWLTDDARGGIKMYQEGNYLREPFPTLSYTKEEKDRYETLYAAISTLASEYEQKWVLGAASVDATWNEYIKTIKGMGLDELISIQQAAYNRYIKEGK